MSAPPEGLISPMQINAMAWDPIMKPLGFQALTSLTSASALTVPAGARVAMLQAEGVDVRYRDDGVDPTGTSGMILASGESIWFNADLTAVKFIEVASNGKLNVLYYGAA